MGAPHAVRWSKSIFNAKTTVCVLLSHKMYKIMVKITKNLGFKGGLPAFRCYYFVRLVTEKVVLASES